jgi:hypothetical protein
MSNFFFFFKEQKLKRNSADMDLLSESASFLLVHSLPCIAKAMRLMDISGGK